MYRTIIKLNENISSEKIQSIGKIITKAFVNRAGSLQNKSNNPSEFIFEGEESDYGCLDLGILSLRVSPVLGDIKAIQWIDEEPEESCDILEVFAKHAV